MLGVMRFESWPLDDLVPYVDWTFFLFAWGMKGRWPEVKADPVRGPEAERLVAEGRAMLDRIAIEGSLEARAAVGFFPANALLGADGLPTGDVAIWADASAAEEAARLSFLRSQDRADGEPCPCLADFLKPAGKGVDWIGAFACSAGFGADEFVTRYRESGADDSSIMGKILADRLAGALAERLHERARKEWWGYAPDEALAPPELLKEAYRGIRPAPGYPACPSHRDKALIYDLLGAADIGMGLTESFMMTPEASVSGFYFGHRDARYFGVGAIGRDQLENWAARMGLGIEAAEKSAGTPVL